MMLGLIAARVLRVSVSAVRLQPLHTASVLLSTAADGTKSSSGFDSTVLNFLRCPLSRKTLRYDESTNELINDELGIAYPIVDGIPNMIPQDARMIHKKQTPSENDQKSE